MENFQLNPPIHGNKIKHNNTYSTNIVETDFLTRIQDRVSCTLHQRIEKEDQLPK